MRKKRSGVAKGVHQGVDLGAQSALAAAECLIFIFFWRAGAVLMSPHDGAVDHRVFVVGIGSQVFKQALPHPVFAPPAEPSMGILPVAESLGQVTPGNSGAVSVEDGFDESAIIVCGYADISRFSRKQVLDSLPLIIAKCISVHGSALFQADSS